ncbi:MAG: mechanosensitive ion channel family protein [Dissulfurispiraceae bacterium]
MKVCRSLINKYGLSSMAVIFWLVLLCPVVDATAEQKSPAPQNITASSPAPSVPTAIPVADVATKATEVASVLQSLTQKLTSIPQVEMIRAALPDVSRHIEQNLTETMNILQRQPTLSTLQTQYEQWRLMQLKNTEWLTVLTKRSNELQDALNRLADLQKIWQKTLDSAKASKAPEPIFQQIDQTTAAIKAVQIPLKEQLTSVLELQSNAADEVAKCGNVLAAITRVQQIAMSGTMVRDSKPLWSPEFWTDALPAVPEHISNIAASNWMEISNYIELSSVSMPLHVGLLIALTLLFLWARNEIRRWENISSGLRVFDHPFAAALSLALFVVTSPFWGLGSDAVRGILQIAALVPMIILIRPTVGVRLIPGLYLLGLLFVMDTVRVFFTGEMLTGQCILVMESLAGIASVIWLLWKIRPFLKEAPESSRMLVLQTGASFILIVLTAGLVAAVMGYVLLARLLTPGILALGSMALALYASVLVVNGMADLAFRLWPIRTLRMVSHHRDMIEKRLYHFLIFGAVAALIVRYLSYIGLLEAALSFVKNVLTAPLERGAFSISLSDILEFFLTVWAAYLLSAFTRFILQEDVYPRIGISTGKSYAVSSLLHYFILALGFTAAIGALGVNLSKLTVLTGAFGVGLGFGLQSVVNNFVSGLILLFERPIHVGDTVEVGDLLGKVQSIGIRASTVYTRQGADIIVPNSQLITDKVTNWTLSNQLRRIDLPLGVNYGAAPVDVIKLLETVAAANPFILPDPAPQGLLMGYGDSTVNFELRAWTDQFDDWTRIRSELAIAVYDAVYAAGMTFAFPQREVRLLRDTEGGATARGGNPVNEK